MFERGTPANTFSTFPSRQFTLVIDPPCVSLLAKSPYLDVLCMVKDLAGLQPPVEILLKVPSHLGDAQTRSSVDQLRPIVAEISKPYGTGEAKLTAELQREARDFLSNEQPESLRVLGLLALANEIQADGIVSNEPCLLQFQYSISDLQGVRIVPLENLADFVEVFAHGHSVFWSVSHLDRTLTVDTFYSRSHWKASRYFQWFMKSQNTVSEVVREDLRSALLNRYVFLLYARDMIRFFDLQKAHYLMRGLIQRFTVPLNYHVTVFYMMLWGMLDHLTVIAKHCRNLTLEERKCGIRKEAFWKEFGQQEVGLSEFIKSKCIDDWITVMADMRHAVAHGQMPIPTSMVTETEDSKRTDEEIRAILRKERAISYVLFPPEMIEREEPLWIWHWRLSKMKIVAHNMSTVTGKNGIYMRDPVRSVDYDMERLTAVLDAFLICLLGRGMERPPGGGLT